jgi:hypothetical protein
VDDADVFPLMFLCTTIGIEGERLQQQLRIIMRGMEGKATMLMFGSGVPDECNAENHCEHIPGKEKGKERTERIAHARNQLLNVARVRGAKTTVPLDLDLTFPEETTDIMGAVYNAHRYFSTGVTLGVTYAGPKGQYYDMWAVRYPESHCNMWHSGCCPFESNMRNNAVVGRRAKRKLMAHITLAKQNQEAIVMDSAFNGIAVYKGTPRCVYHGLDDCGQSDCEHAAFNKCIGGVIIDPQFPMAEAAFEHLV